MNVTCICSPLAVKVSFSFYAPPKRSAPAAGSPLRKKTALDSSSTTASQSPRPSAPPSPRQERLRVAQSSYPTFDITVDRRTTTIKQWIDAVHAQFPDAKQLVGPHLTFYSSESRAQIATATDVTNLLSLKSGVDILWSSGNTPCSLFTGRTEGIF